MSAAGESAVLKRQYEPPSPPPPPTEGGGGGGGGGGGQPIPELRLLTAAERSQIVEAFHMRVRLANMFVDTGDSDDSGTALMASEHDGNLEARSWKAGNPSISLKAK